MDEFQTLLDRFWITRTANKDLYFTVKRALPRYRRFINEQLGWNLIVNEAVIKLEKVPPKAMSWMGIQDFQEKLEAGTTIVLNHDYLFLRSVLPKRCTEFNVRLYSLNTEITGDGVCLTGDRVVTLKAGGVERPLLPAEDLLLQGERNLGIYLAAVSAVGPAAGTDVIARELRAFRGDRKHFSCYPLERGVRLYVQLNTGLPSMAEAAFVGFERRLVIVTGNFAEQPDDVSYQGLALMISAYARKLVLFGPDRDILEYAVRKVGVGKSWELPIVKKETADAAVRYAVNSAYPGEWVMFSPVDASDSRYFDPERMAFVVET